MKSEVLAVIANFERWKTNATEEHADILERANNLFVEHGFEPFSGWFVDAISNFKSHLETEALNLIDENAEDENPGTQKQIEEWTRRAISEGSYDDMILAAIYANGAEEVDWALDDGTPTPDEAPSMI